MTHPVRIIHLEDRANDAELVRAELDNSGLACEVVTVSTRDAFIAALDRGGVDLILSDYSLPNFDGLAALAIAQKSSPDAPFILVSGTMGEEAAIDSLRSGATDYVLKHRLTRLAPAVHRALEEAAGRRARSATEATLERERIFLRALLDSLETGVVACDQAGVVTLSNRATRELHGLPEGPLSPETWGSHYQLYDADGISLLKTEDLPLHRVLRGERLRNVEMVIRHASGVERTVLASGQPITDDHGLRLGGVVALHDITDRKELEAQFRQAHKMEAMGMLAAGVAHDFNNLLTVINCYCELLNDQLEPGHPGLGDVEEIANAGRRASDLTRQLLAFSRRQVLQTRVLDLNTVVADVGSMLQRLIGSDIELAFTSASDLGSIRADAGQIEQVLLNLVINARDAMSDGGKISIRTSNCTVSEARLAVSQDATRKRAAGSGSVGSVHVPYDIPPGDYVALTVTDTGCGMDSETAAQVFVPFFTTKDASRGTGLGLSTVHGIVTQSGGYIALETTPTVGTSFTVYLPLIAGASDSVGSATAEHPATRATETVLVVDDDPAIRSLVNEILRLDGYSMILAEDGESALATIENGSRSIDAVIVDLVLPGLSGRELGARVRRLWPNIPVLYMSGQGDKGPENLRTILGLEVNYIQKPFTAGALRRKLRDVLNGQAAEAA